MPRPIGWDPSDSLIQHDHQTAIRLLLEADGRCAVSPMQGVGPIVDELSQLLSQAPAPREEALVRASVAR